MSLVMSSKMEICLRGGASYIILIKDYIAGFVHWELNGS